MRVLDDSNCLAYQIVPNVKCHCMLYVHNLLCRIISQVNGKTFWVSTTTSHFTQSVEVIVMLVFTAQDGTMVQL